MKIKIRTGNTDELYFLASQIREFETPYPKSLYQERLAKVQQLILIAEVNGKNAGFKAGYEREKDGSFYSWVGGVLPEYRRLGIAQLLLNEMEKRVKKMGYSALTFKTQNHFKNMLLFSIKNNFDIIKTEPKPNPKETRIWLKKEL